MGSKRLINIKKNTNKTIKEIYDEYLDYCISIGQSDGTIQSKKHFFKFCLPKIVNVEDKISTFTKDKLERHIIEMRRAEYSGNYYQTYVIKSKAFLTYCFNHYYLNKFEVKIPRITQQKKKFIMRKDLLNC